MIPFLIGIAILCLSFLLAIQTIELIRYFRVTE